jgi:hypothetical protein
VNSVNDAEEVFMKRAVTILAILFVVGCTTVQNFGEADRLKTAAWTAIGREQVAWIARDSASLPGGMESLVSLKVMRAHVDNVSVPDGTVTTTYWYTGTFSTEQGQRDGTLTVQRRLHFKRGDSGVWTQSAPAEEIARNSQWSSARSTS